MIPSKMLSICSSVISRPAWEYILKIFLVVGVSIAIIASALMAYVEAGSIVSNTVLATVRVVPGGSEASKDLKETTSKLDLKGVYDKVENRFKRNSAKEYSSGKTVQSNGNSAVSNSSNALVLSKSGMMANGTTVLSSNNNSIRNRRGGGAKKGGVDQQQQQTSSLVTSSTRLLDKSNSQDNSPSLEDITSGSSSNPGGFSKKNKENSPSSGEGGSVNSSSSGKKKKGGGGNGGASSNSTVSSPLSSYAVNSQVNAATSVSSKKKRHRSGSNGSLSNVCLVTGSTVKSLNKAEQEETSSTTTESSNSDDFYIPPSDKKSATGYLSQQQQQTRKESRANSPGENNNCSSTSQSSSSKGKKDSNSKKNKQNIESGNLTDIETVGCTEGISVQKSGSPLGEDGAGGNGKKKNGKRKDQQNNLYGLDGVVAKTGDGTTSPNLGAKHPIHHHPGPLHHHHDMAMWDSPQRPMGDGLSELAAQTEMFTNYRPPISTTGKKPGNAEHLMGQQQTILSTEARLARNSHSPPMPHMLQQIANYQAQQQLHMAGAANLRHRRHPAGIIGQSRYGPPPGGIMSPTAAFFQGLTAPNRQHTPPTRNLSNPSVGLGLGNPTGPSTGWGTDILPDNGCDIWSRRNSGENNNNNNATGGAALGQTFSSVAGSSSTSSLTTNDLPPMYSSGNMVPPGYSSLFDGFPTSSSPGLSNRSSDDGGYFSLGNAPATGASAMVSSASGATAPSRNNPSRNTDKTQMFGGYGMEIFNNLNLPLSSGPYDNLPLGYRSSVSTSTAASGRPPVSMSGGNPTSHNYLHRMRSEPVAREEVRGYGAGTASSKLFKLVIHR